MFQKHTKHPKLFFAVLCVRATASKYLLPFAYGNAVKTSSLIITAVGNKWGIVCKKSRTKPLEELHISLIFSNFNT